VPFTVDDIEIDGNVISSITTNTDLELTANGTGLVKFENLGFTDSTIKNTVSGAVTVFVLLHPANIIIRPNTKATLFFILSSRLIIIGNQHSTIYIGL